MSYPENIVPQDSQHTVKLTDNNVLWIIKQKMTNRDIATIQNISVAKQLQIQALCINWATGQAFQRSVIKH